MAANSEIAALSTASAPAGCLTTAVTLACIRNLYETSDYIPKVPDTNYVGITNYLNQTVFSINRGLPNIAKLTIYSHLISISEPI
jgi:hypothetical protein